MALSWLGNTVQPEKACVDCLLQPGKQRSEKQLQGSLCLTPGPLAASEKNLLIILFWKRWE